MQATPCGENISSERKYSLHDRFVYKIWSSLRRNFFGSEDMEKVHSQTLKVGHV